MAARLDITPSLSFDQVYDSNVFNTDGKENEDFFLRVTPGIILSLRMPETTLNLRSSLISDTYYKYSNLDSTSAAISLSLDADPPITFSPRASIAPTAHYIQAEDSFRRTQLLPTTDPLSPPSVTVESGVRRSRDYGGGLRIIYQVTPNTELTLGGGYSKREFPGAAVDNTTEEVGSRVFYGDTSVSYRFTPLLSTGVFVSASNNRFENGRDSRSYAGGLIAGYRFSPGAIATARAGASRTGETSPGDPENVDWSPYGVLSIAYSTSGFDAILTGSVQQSGGGSFGATTELQSISLSVTRQFTARWRGNLSGVFQKSKSIDPLVSEDLESVTGTAGVRYQPWSWASIHLSGTTYQQWSYGLTGTDLTRFSALLGVTLGYNFNLF